ncbi:MAG: hypothetical protein ACI3YK_03650 [Eubacteriales bacterium]
MKRKPKSPLSVLYGFCATLAGMAVLDVICYGLGGADQGVLALVFSMLYLYLTLIQVLLCPICLICAVVLWIRRLAANQKIDVHGFVTLGLMILALLWAIFKIVFLIGEF